MSGMNRLFGARLCGFGRKTGILRLRLRMTDVYLGAGAADGHLVELDGGHAYAYGDGLAGLAAGSYAFVESQIVSDHGDVLEGVGAVADEGCAFYRAGDLAVFDQVGLAGREDELAVGD